MRYVILGFADLGTVVKHIHLLNIKAKDAQEELDLARFLSLLVTIYSKLLNHLNWNTQSSFVTSNREIFNI